MSSPDLVRLVAPYLVRAYRDGILRGYAVLDQFGWAIHAPIRESGRRVWRMVDRYTLWPNEPPRVLRAGALVGLARYAATGKTGDGMGEARSPL